MVSPCKGCCAASFVPPGSSRSSAASRKGMGVAGLAALVLAMAMARLAVCRGLRASPDPRPTTGTGDIPLDRQPAIQATRCSWQVRRIAGFVVAR